MNNIQRTNVVVKLLDERGVPAMTWTLMNAWPTKVSGIDLKLDGNQVAIGSIEVACEGIIVNKD